MPMSTSMLCTSNKRHGLRVHSRHACRYPFNDTAGSASVTDYSGNGFHGTAIGRTPPTFTSNTMILDSAQRQHVRIDRCLGPTLHSLFSSYSVTMSVRFNNLNRWPRLFTAGVSSEYAEPA